VTKFDGVSITSGVENISLPLISLV